MWFRDESNLVRDDEGAPMYLAGRDARYHGAGSRRGAAPGGRVTVPSARRADPVVTYLEAFEPSKRRASTSARRSKGSSVTRPRGITGPEAVWPGLMHPDDYSRVMSVNKRRSARGPSSTSSTGWWPRTATSCGSTTKRADPRGRRRGRCSGRA